MRPERDTELVQIVNASLADATVRSLKPDGSSWLSCRPGCTPCCHGVFHISALDAERLRAGLHELRERDSERASRLQERAETLREVLTPHFPGDPRTGLLSSSDDTAWDAFADLPEADAACPVLDPASGRCDLYAARPLTCRVFGPPVLNENGIGLCELCYKGASESEILRGEMHLDHSALEEQLDRELPQIQTVIAWALLP